MRKVEIGDCTLYLGDCLEVMKGFEAGSVDAVVTDPPYGCGKAEWDLRFPTEWYELTKPLACPVYIITGGASVADSVNTVGSDFVDCIAARNMNSRTRSKIGFSNWLAVVVANGKPKKNVPNAFDFVIRGKMPKHPSPKPIEFMDRLLGYITTSQETILDPFMGSGTTGVACVNLGRRFIGIELDESYFEIACDRIRNAYETKQQELIPA